MIEKLHRNQMDKIILFIVPPDIFGVISSRDASEYPGWDNHNDILK